MNSRKDSTLQISDIILKNFQKCSIWRAYRAYFEKKIKIPQVNRVEELSQSILDNVNTDTNFSDDNGDDITSVLPKSEAQTPSQSQTASTATSTSQSKSQPQVPLQKRHKKTKRGKRGGKNQFYKKMNSKTIKIPSTAPNSNSNQNLNQNHNQIQNSKQIQNQNQIQVSTLTIGEKLVSRPLRNGLFDRTITINGYESQDIQFGLRNKTTPQKRKRNNLNDYPLESNSLEENLPLNKKSSNCGSDYHIQMRTMLTEV